MAKLLNVTEQQVRFRIFLLPYILFQARRLNVNKLKNSVFAGENLVSKSPDEVEEAREHFERRGRRADEGQEGEPAEQQPESGEALGQ